MTKKIARIMKIPFTREFNDFMTLLMRAKHIKSVISHFVSFFVRKNAILRSYCVRLCVSLYESNGVNTEHCADNSCCVFQRSLFEIFRSPFRKSAFSNSSYEFIFLHGFGVGYASI